MIAAALVAGAPIPASAAPGEYELTLPSGGSDDGSSSTTTPVAPTTPTYAPTTPTYETTVPLAEENGGKKKKREAKPEPVLASAPVNATLGPQRIPPLKVGDSGGGIPVLPAVLAVLAAACCALAVWRLRYLRELPTAPRPETAPIRPRTALATTPPRRPAGGAPSLS